MTKQDFIIRNAIIRDRAIDYISNLDMGRAWEVIVREYEDTRSNQQNRLQRRWMNDLERQGDMSAEQYRGFCKLHFGVPIRREDDPEFCRAYDMVIKPLPYELKLLAMQIPLDFPVTRDMKVKQKTRYLDAIEKHFAGEGFYLTHPEDLQRHA